MLTKTGRVIIPLLLASSSILADDPPSISLSPVRVGKTLDKTNFGIVFLHGYGGSSSSFDDLSKRIASELDATCLLIEAPFKTERGGGNWIGETNEDFDQCLEQIHQLILSAKSRYPEAKFAMLGFSQGGMVIMNAMKDPLPLDRVVLLSPIRFVQHEPSSQNSKTKVYIAHGQSDELVKFWQAADIHGLFESAGCDVDFNHYEGGHAMPESVIDAAVKFLQGG